MADPRDRQDDEAGILQNLIDQSGAPTKPDQPGADADSVEMRPDGSAVIRKNGNDKKPSDGKFYRNLALELPPPELDKIANSLIKLIEDDKKAREERDKQYEEGLKRMGLSKETLGGANFIGASVVVHPMYVKACIDFEARAIKEILPATGPCREVIPGTITTEKTDRARRKAKWLNYLFTVKMPHFRTDMEQMLIQLPMGGDQYIKLLPPTSRRFALDHEWIPVDEMLLPEAARSYASAERRTHLQKLTATQFAERVRSGFYVDEKALPAEDPERTDTEQAAAKIEGKEETGTNIDQVRLIYECDCLFEIPVEDNPDMIGDFEPLPYLISINSGTRKVLGIYRNWEKTDEDHERLDWVAPFPFIPFRGAYSLGLPHIIGGLSIAATGALRALLDSAHINNIATLLKLKGAPGTGQTLRPSQGEVLEIEGTAEVDDIRKIIMSLPFNPPSPVLFELLGFLDTKGEQVIRTTLDEAQDNANVPVGTQMMRIEQGMVVFSAIHARLHNAMDKLLQIVHRMCETYLEDSDVMDALGEQLVSRKDFEGPCDILPVSDPNIFCELQRYAQIQTVAQRAGLYPPNSVYDNRKVELLILKQMRLPNDGQDLLIAKPEPQQLNPVNENIALALSRPIVAFPEQDHEAHIETHCDFLENPIFQILVGSSPQSVGGLMQHLKEHISFWYGMQVHRIASDTATQVAKERDPKSEAIDIGELPQNHPSDPELGQQFDRMLAAAASQVMKQAPQNQQINRAMQTIQKLQQALQQMQPPQAQDPTQAMMAETQRKSKRDDAEIQLQGKKLDQDQQTSQAADQTDLTKTNIQEQGDMARQQAADATKIQITREDNATAEGIALDKNLMGAASNVTTGTAVNKSGPGESPPK